MSADFATRFDHTAAARATHVGSLQHPWKKNAGIAFLARGVRLQ
jgi:hypothetical protein